MCRGSLAGPSGPVGCVCVCVEGGGSLVVQVSTKYCPPPHSIIPPTGVVSSTPPPPTPASHRIQLPDLEFGLCVCVCVCVCVSGGAIVFFEEMAYLVYILR